MLKEAYGDSANASTVSIGLYDTSDNLEEADDLDQITTEPQGSGYDRQDATIGSDFTFQNNSGDWETTIDDLVYDTGDSSADVDGYFVVVEFESEEAGDASPAEHLIFSGELDQLYDLDSVTSFTLQGSGISLT